MLSSRGRAVTGCGNGRFSILGRTALAGLSNAMTEKRSHNYSSFAARFVLLDLPPGD
jgi:hypothetical protein